jgi:hypothetical protein
MAENEAVHVGKPVAMGPVRQMTDFRHVYVCVPEKRNPPKAAELPSELSYQHGARRPLVSAFGSLVYACRA